MTEFTTILVGALVSCATFLINKLTTGIVNDALKTAVKALVTLAVAFLIACLQLFLQGNFTWPELWGNLPVVIASAMTFYGLILKPVTE